MPLFQKRTQNIPTSNGSHLANLGDHRLGRALRFEHQHQLHGLARVAGSEDETTQSRTRLRLGYTRGINHPLDDVGPGTQTTGVVSLARQN
jgi:hypothetical protein